MTTSARHKEGLSRKHEGLERAIEAERARPAADEVRIKDMKLRKLRVKDEMAAIDRGD